MMADASRSIPLSALDFALLNDWQHDFPLCGEPFGQIARTLATTERDVLNAFARLQQAGVISRIGGVFAPGAGGAALLAAMAVPADELEVVATTVSAHPGVNHNYQREHAYNLWFVMTGRDAAAVEMAMQALERATGLPALRLRMEKAYRIDLGFDLRHRTAEQPMRVPRSAQPQPVADAHAWLAQRVEVGLPIISRPFDHWARSDGCQTDDVLARLSGWLAQGTLKRFGVVVRHHELGFRANAMTVFDVPDHRVDECGHALAMQAGVTLAYRRMRAPEWPYNLYFMVHGTDREAVHAVIDRVADRSGLAAYPHAVLFSTRRFKQTGARRFRPIQASDSQENRDALAR